MLSRFHLIPECYGRTDRPTNGQTDLLYQYRASVCWRAIKTVESAEYKCWSQQCNSTNSAAILRMEIKHVSLLLFKNNNVARGSQGFVHQSSRNVALRVVQPPVLNKFFQNYNMLPRSGVRAESLRVWSENTPNFVIFGPPCSLRMTRKKIQVVTSLMTLKVHHV